ncbi:MAG: CHASE2 domain-containing protein [Leptolyngbyaceae cyanobacterium]
MFSINLKSLLPLKRYSSFFLIPPVTVALVLGLRMLSVFEPFELFLLDSFFRLRPHESADSRITIVTVDEEHLRQLAQWPLTDETLARLITNIRAQNPRVIALDIYRDFPNEPGSQQLADVFASTPNLIGIEQVGEIVVAPPPQLDRQNQVGFSNLMKDADGRVRRAILSVNDDNDGGELKFGLATLAALQYLSHEQIFLEPKDPNTASPIDVDPDSPQRVTVRLGDAIFQSLVPFWSGYGNIDTNGYQIMLNYRRPRRNFKTFRQLSIIDALENRIPEDDVSDRIVFIGVTAPSLNDLFLTPYRTSNLIEFDNSQTPGVEIHAQISSQILSAALDDRPLLKVSHLLGEALCILVTSAISVFLVSRYFKRQQDMTGSVGLKIVASLLGASTILIGSSFGVFLVGWWIPAATSITAMAIAGVWAIIWQNQSLIWQNQSLHHMAYLDGLTKVPNRRCFDDYLATQLSSTESLSVILCDIDYFKRFNDTYGHQEGDRCLVQVAQALQHAVRSPDFVARYGGEEFVVVLPKTNIPVALEVAERMRRHVQENQIPHKSSDVSDYVSLSCGVATLQGFDFQNSRELIEAADKALYEAKLKGRNCVCAFEEESYK